MAKVKITTMMDGEILKRVKIRAIEEDMNIGEILEKAFEFYLDSIFNKTYVFDKMSRENRAQYLSGLMALKTELEKEIKEIDRIAKIKEI